MVHATKALSRISTGFLQNVPSLNTSAMERVHGAASWSWKQGVVLKRVLERAE